MHCMARYCRLVIRTVRNMSSSYEEAIHKLNLLQSNKSTLEQIRRDIKNGKSCTNLDDMENYLLRIGIPLSKLDDLSVIHVAGTKGKGSTSAMCESILRHHGFRTGFYSSPHLVAVRERIRLCGCVVDKEYFAKHFHQVYNMLYKSQVFEGDMPKYFAFMTVLAYSMFLKEKVDVAIVEVGIGGIVDYTNVLRKVPVVGITALGIDHTALLGSTLEKIAAAKAGIMKPGCVAYTVNQPKEAMDVLVKVANEVKCSLHVVPEYQCYKFPETHVTESPYNLEAYQMNASLAIQLAHRWLRLMQSSFIDRKIIAVNRMNGNVNKQKGFLEIEPFVNNCDKVNGNVSDYLITTIPDETSLGLRECRWPGRYQIIHTDYAQFYLDGAHTKESIEICAKWFIENNRLRDKILIFSATGNRDAYVLLKPLKCIDFTSTFFVVPTASKEIDTKNDNYSVNEFQEAYTSCLRNADIWKEMSALYSETNTEECVEHALNKIKQKFSSKPSILITGSLHLVGAALSILNPHLKED